VSAQKKGLSTPRGAVGSVEVLRKHHARWGLATLIAVQSVSGRRTMGEWIEWADRFDATCRAIMEGAVQS
jgi:hypothetical protein